jgi:hypothetical protein
MRYFLGFLGIVALVIVVFVLVVRGFSGKSTPKTQTLLTDYTNTSTVMRLTAEGPVTANQKYNEVHITVGRDANTIEVIQGYQSQVVKAQTYPNNANAYGNFLSALQLLNYTKGNSDPKLADERGYCPTGSRYVYEIVSGASDVQRYWTGSCGGGTFKGSAAVIRTLFTNQIPDFETFVAGLNLSV